ncbi:MAG: DUF979 domain-containing protein [Arenimonas sp.]
MLRLEYAYWLVAAFFAFTAWTNFGQRRWVATAFWGVLAILFVAGDYILAQAKLDNHVPGQLAGLGVLVLAVLAPRMKREHLAERPESERMASAMRLGGRLFLPALVIPVVTVVIVLLKSYAPESITWLVGDASPTLVGLALACVLGAITAVAMTGAPLMTPAREGRRLLDTLGWAALLPQLLAGLGAVFAATGVGDIVAQLIGQVIPTDSRIACVLAYGLGMVVFTMIMGNAFAAFPIMTAGIALPLLVHQHGASAPVLCAIGMVTGYCGTLMTPMAANFNIVPAALLELDDPNGVIRVQIATALPLLAVNLVLMAWLPFL